MMAKLRIWLMLIGLFVFLAGACEDKRVKPLQDELMKTKQDLSKTGEELKTAQTEVQRAKQQLETLTGELSKTITDAKEKDKMAQVEIETLKGRLSKHFSDLSKNGIVIPTYLLDKSVVIYTRPVKGTNEEVGIFIGVVKDIVHNEKIVLGRTEIESLVEIPYEDILGYRLTK